MIKVGTLGESQGDYFLQFQREETKNEGCERRNQLQKIAQRIVLTSSQTAGRHGGSDGATSPMSLYPTPPGMTRSLARSKGPNWPSVPRLRFTEAPTESRSMRQGAEGDIPTFLVRLRS